jgi:YVTN family beta-propeller protein
MNAAGQDVVPLVTGKQITPQGKQINVGSFPAHMLLSLDGRYVVVTNTGYRQFLSVLSVEDGRIVSQIEVGAQREAGTARREGLYVGLAFGPSSDGKTLLYASRGAEEKVAIYTLDSRGRLEDTGRRLENSFGRKEPWASNVIAGLALSQDGNRLYVADNNTNVYTDLKGSLSILDTAANKRITRVTLPGFPFAVAAITNGPNADKKVYVTSERDGVVSVVDPNTPRLIRNIKTGANPMALLLDRKQERLFVANAGSDTVSILDTRSDRVTHTILLRPDDLRGLPGVTPTGLALSPDESRLYVTLADMNAVAVVALPEGKLEGYIPVGWYPTSVVASPDGKRLFVANAKGVSTRNPNDKPVGPDGRLGRYIQNIIEGTVSVIDTPDATALSRMTAQTIQNNRVAEAKQVQFRNPGIEHVIYIIKENRTYDQVLGDLPQGNGDPSLCFFPREVTPNQHALAERFVLLDNFYCCAEVSADGWNWSTSGMVNEYTARNTPYNYSGRGRAYDFEGQNNGTPVDLLGLTDVARAPGGYIWDLCLKHGVSFRNYGFFLAFSDENAKGSDGKPLATENTPTKKALIARTNLNFRLYDLSYADSDAWVIHNAPAPDQRKEYGAFKSPSRFSEWKREFDEFVKNGNLPRFLMVRLPRNHTRGTTPNAPSPRAMVADNDYAVGQLVEAVSKSPYWKKTAIFIVEDDAQNGFDHVDAHRSTAFVISPFIKKGTVDSRFYNTDSVLRTMELLLGLPPMNQYDAVATPFDFFSDKPENDQPYTAILPDRKIIAEINQPTAYRAQDSARFNFEEPDSVPDEELNDILWHAIMGEKTPKPPIRYSLRTALFEKPFDNPSSLPPSTIRGLWLTPRKDALNQARADVRGKTKGAPKEIWRMPTGGEVRFSRIVRVGKRECVLAQVGATLQLLQDNGQIVWREATLGVESVLHVGDFGGDGKQQILVLTDPRTVVLLSVANGQRLWSWTADPNSNFSGYAIYPAVHGLRLIAFPAYSYHGYCFDFSGNVENPKLLWKENYVGKYGLGYGPSIVLKDMDRDGKLDIVLSGKTSSVYQAVLDVDTGNIKFDVYYDVEGWGRPYGLFQATDLDGDGWPDTVMICCQVEEYIGIARNVGGKKLEKIWGKFIDKDFPTDLKELRPQITSVVDVQGNGKVELVVGLWENDIWQTLVIDPLKGFDARRGSLKDCYFWGCYDLTGDNVPEIIVSEEKRRLLGRISTLLALDGKTLRPVATLPQAAVFTSSDSELPGDTFFMAVRNNPVYLKTAGGFGGILVRRFDTRKKESGVFLWAGKPGVPITLHKVAGAGFSRVDVHDNHLLLSDAVGNIQRFDRSPKPVGRWITTAGRMARSLVWAVGNRRELIVDVAGGKTIGGRPVLTHPGKLEGRWEVAGHSPVAHIDSAGCTRLALVAHTNCTDPAVLLYKAPMTAAQKPIRIPLPYPVYIQTGLVPYGQHAFRLLVTMQTGTHTMALATYDAAGKLVWEDRNLGAHPRTCAAGDVNGDGREEVVADDHGLLRIYSATGQVLASYGNWPPAYTLPIIGPFGPRGETRILRAAGIDSLALIDSAAKLLWNATGARWRYFRSLPAVGDTTDSGRLMLGTFREDGYFDCIDTVSGKVVWSLPLHVRPNNSSVVAGDINGDGKDEFLVGLPNGVLVCIGEEEGQGKVLWQVHFGSGVNNPVIADVDGDGMAEIILSTSDGYVRILR